MSEVTKEQVQAQCRAVAHLAKVIAGMHDDYVKLLDAGAPLPLAVVGQRTAHFMELLGDMVNGMDAADDDDEWTEPIFAEAQRLWPGESDEGDHA